MSLKNSSLDKNVPVPLYYQLKKLLLENIKNGTYPPESMIPTELELCSMFGISRTTIRQAITELVQEGWLYRIKSKGTFVSRPKIRQDFLSKIESFNSELARKGLTPSTLVLELSEVPASGEIADIFGIKTKTPVIFLHRLRFADNQPIVLIKTYLPGNTCRYLLGKDFTKNSLYQELSVSDTTKIVRIRRHVEAVSATSFDAEKLKLKKGNPILLTYSTGYNIYDQIIEYSVARYRGDRSSFDITVAPGI